MNKISEAISFAAEKHDKQKRKLNNHPYIFHLCEVGQIVSYMTNDEDTIAAAILHDTVEDTGTSIGEIEEKFGKRVRELVAGETEDKMRDKKPADTWRQRKLDSLKELRESKDVEEKKIWLADKMSNIRSIFIYHALNGRKTFELFNEKDPLNHKWYYLEIAKILEEDLGNEPIYREYVRLINRLFEGYE